MEAIKLEAKVRAGTGKMYARQMRREGNVPSIVYGADVESTPIEVPEKEVEKFLAQHGDNALIKLVVTGDGETNEYASVIRELQRHPVRGGLYHIDFFQISLKDKLETVVPIHLTGEPIGVKEGGILQYGIREVDVECLPTDIPEYFEVDISELNIGDNSTVADIKTPEGVELLSDAGSVVAMVVAPRMEVEETEDEEGAEAADVPTVGSPEGDDAE